MAIKLLYYDILRYRSDTLELMNQLFDVITLRDPREDQREVLQDVRGILAPLGFPCNREKIDKCPRLIVIGSNTTGEPHIDRAYAESKGIAVVSLMKEQDFLESITATAEHTFGLILAVMRHIPSSFTSVLSGIWNRRLFGGKRMLSSQSIGVLGLGRLGTWVARYATAFGMKVYYYDPYVLQDKVPPDWSHCKTLEDLVSIVDIVTLHVPANEETRHLVNRKVFSKFKPASYFINTARAECVDEEALLEALESGKLAGAGIDVLGGEFEPDFNPISHSLVRYAQTHENLVITPHIGGSTEDAWVLTEQRTLRKMYEVINEK